MCSCYGQQLAGDCCVSLQVLFDTLKFHGASFTAPFWARVFDSVLLPIFDHVRAEVSIQQH